MRRARKSRVAKIAAIIICAIILGDIGAGLYFFNVAFVRRPAIAATTPLPPSETDEARTKLAYDQGVAQWLEAQKLEDVTTTSDDGLILHAYFLAARDATQNTVILVHGYRGEAKKDMGQFARLYHDRLNYNVLMVDDRAHGQSQGKYIGFGWLDHKDVLKWVEFLLQRPGQNAKIVLHGLSMGGVAVLLDSAESLPANVKAIVSDSAFTDATEELTVQLAAQYNLPPFPILPTSNLINWIVNGYRLEQDSAVKAVHVAKVPILFIHGGDDDYVPTRMAYTLYDSCTSPKELLIIPHARHTYGFYRDPEQYQKTLTDFLAKYVDGSTASTPK